MNKKLLALLLSAMYLAEAYSMHKKDEHELAREQLKRMKKDASALHAQLKSHDELLNELRYSSRGYFYGIDKFKEKLNAMDKLSKQEARQIDSIAGSYRIFKNQETLCHYQFGLAFCTVAGLFGLSALSRELMDSPKDLLKVAALPVTAIGLIEVAKKVEEKNNNRIKNIRNMLKEKIGNYFK